jgi:hypothetical protein
MVVRDYWVERVLSENARAGEAKLRNNAVVSVDCSKLPADNESVNQLIQLPSSKDMGDL